MNQLRLTMALRPSFCVDLSERSMCRAMATVLDAKSFMIAFSCNSRCVQETGDDVAYYSGLMPAFFATAA